MSTPKHFCVALNKEIETPRAFNTADPDTLFYRCPFCGYIAPSTQAKGGN